MCSSQTAIAKGLFVALLYEGHIHEDSRGLYTVGTTHYWISSRERAYRLEELGLEHLDNIVRKYAENMEELPEIFYEVRKQMVEEENGKV